MNLQKYPNYFLAACILYAIVFLTAFGYIFVPILNLGFLAEIYLVVIMVFLPLPLLILYNFTPRFHFLWGKEKILRFIITVLTIIDFFIVMLFMSMLI